MVLIVVCCGSCSTKKNTFTRRFYHNMTAHYNGYFNGNEALKDGVAALDKAHIDDYSKVLKIYRLGTADDATAQNTNFDKAFTKASTVAQKHSIFIKNKEYVRWIPEAYLLIGKSYFYKQEYKLAAEAFDYIIKQYDNWPIRYNAMLWLVRCYDEQKKYEKSESTLALVQSKIEKKLVPKSALKEYPVVYADYELKQENYEQSIEYLISGIELNKKKALKVRLRFILAQVYQKTGNPTEATKLYDKVIRMNPAYEMAFNAKINKAICFDATSGNSKELKKLLNKMAKETKNKDYLDQIYYALAEICMKEQDTTCAIDNYKLSAEKSVSNTNQKATSYLKLANLYYSKPEYELAEAYYDSTMTVLPTDYPDYKKIKTLATTLSDLVDNIRIVELQDSLQKLSKMTPEERNKIVNDIITSVIKEEQKKQEAEYLKQQNIYTAGESTIASTSSSWYFYNTTTVNFGKTEFVKKWGSRKLEDLWRLSNKQAESTFDDGTDDSDTSGTDTTIVTTSDLKDKNYYLKNIPSTPEDFAKSDEKIAAALYSIGQIYQSDLLDYTKAVETYEELIKRFPQNEDYVLKTYYQLYLIYDAASDAAKKEYYKNLVCTKGPESDYCNMIKDPNFKKISTENKNLAALLYEETYNSFLEAKWDSVLAKSTRAINQYGKDTSLLPKFYYLKAAAQGNSKDSLGMVASLKYIIDNYSGSSIKNKAQVLYDFCTGKTKESSTSKTDTTNKTNTSPEGYTVDDDALYLYVVVVKLTDKNTKIADIKNALSDFNTKNYSATKFTVSNIFLDNKQQMITISNFENRTKAMLYYNAIKGNTTVFGKLKPADYTQFVISVDNYPVMYKKKDIDNYYKFFLENYPK